MTILEEVIMYTFQQCVYYITKVICHRGNGAIFIMNEMCVVFFLLFFLILILKRGSMNNNSPHSQRRTD